jgi:hypothetical protein
MPVREVQWSDLTRDPKGVAALADAGEVRLKRRDGADLVLSRADRVSAADEGAVTAARAFRNLLAHTDPDVAATAFLDEFPWVRQLPDQDIKEFVTDFIRASLAAAELGRWEVLTQTIREWKATAAVYAEPGLAEKLTKPITDEDEFLPATPPVATEG